MKKSSSIIIGLLLIALGIILGLKQLDIVNINIFFKGWWTLFIIVPSVVSLINDDNKISSLATLAIGVLLLLGARNIIDFDTVLSLIFPICIILFGFYIIVKSSKTSDFRKKFKETSGDKDYVAIFSGQKYVSGKEFKSSNTVSVFGGVDLDLRDAEIKDDVVIKSINIFGGTDIFVPKDVNVEVNCIPVFGGVENKVKNQSNKPTIYIDAICIFGEIDIK